MNYLKILQDIIKWYASRYELCYEDDIIVIVNLVIKNENLS